MTPCSRHNWLAAPFLLVVLALLLLPSVACARVARPAEPSPEAAQVVTTIPAQTNVSYCALLGSNPGSVNTVGPIYTPNATIVWYKLCASTSFQELVSSWGGLTLLPADNNTTLAWVAANLSVGAAGNRSVPVVATWAVNWVSICENLTVAPTGGPCAHQTYWWGNVTSNTLNGPHSFDYPIMSSGPIPCTHACQGKEDPVLPFPLVLGLGLATGAVLGAVGLVLVLHRKH
jgi:hypothetical protein